jgi:hypothetical protein
MILIIAWIDFEIIYQQQDYIYTNRDHDLPG